MLQRSILSRNVHALLAAAAVVVSLAPLSAQSFYKATVTEQVGQVSLFESGSYTALSKGSLVSPTQVIVTGPDGYAKFQVSDGSTFEVFFNSRVVFREHPGSWQELLNVWMGRVKVFIQHEPGKPNHNEVSSPTAVISVRGTMFDVVVEDSDGTTLVTVDEGVVTVRNFTAPGPQVQLLKGDFVRVFKGQPLLGKQIDKGNALKIALEKAKELVYQVMLQRQGGAGPIPTGSAPGVNQSDKDKNGTKGTGTPGSPPPPVGSPPPPPGGGGN